MAAGGKTARRKPARKPTVMTGKIILVTGASRGFGRLTANVLAQSGHTVYASMRETVGRNASQVRDVQAYALEQGVDLRAIEIDIGSDASVDVGVSQIIDMHGQIDVVVHNAGHMAFGPAESFTTDQFAELYDINVLSAQRVNRAALPQMRRQREGLLVWVSASGTAGGNLPYQSPYLAAKAGMDALAVQYARELARWGIETCIIVPGPLTRSTSHFAHAVRPADEARAAEYEVGPYAGLTQQVRQALDGIVPEDADPAQIAGAIASVVDTPFGERPFRVHIDPSDDGAAVAFGVIDRIRNEMLSRVGMTDLTKPRGSEG
jgi:NAD(P)-dependent dehydrogenase (short-subunit alcohol dehydrogenase family)